MLRRVVILLVLSALCMPLLAQRSIGIVEPRETDETLVFDVNEFPVTRNPALQGGDFNFAPRVIHAPDSQKAFVTFPGTNKLASFDSRSGEVLGVVEVCSNPGQLTLTPDGTKLALPCLFLQENRPTPQDLEGAQIGAIVVVDTATLQTERLDLQETVFSVVTNIVFTADGSSGFISSIGTDEILRFSLDPLAETGRMALTPGTRPASLTMAADGSFFGAVLVGSSTLPREETPDSVQIIDVDSFSMRQSLTFRPEGPNELPIDFRADNRVAFTPDGQFAMIAEQANSVFAASAGFPPGLSPDRALLFNVETGEMEDLFMLPSGVALGSDVTPDGGSFVVLTLFNIVIINVEQRNALSVTTNPSEFQPSSRVAFSPRGDYLYVAAPLTDFIMAVRLATGEMFRGIFIGGTVERPFGEAMIEVPSAPLDVSLSPDGQVITALNFNANTIELLKPTFPLYVPELVSANDNSEGEIEPEDLFTGVAVTNVGDQPADLILSAFESSGTIFRDDSDTEDVEEFQNPNERTLEPNQQFAFTLNDLLVPVPAPEEEPVDLDGWVDIDTDRETLAGLFLTFNRGLTKLDGGPLPDRGTQFVAFPEPPLEFGKSNLLVITNPNLSGSFTATISLISREGELINQFNQQVGARARRSFLLRSPEEDPEELPEFPILFPEANFEDFEGGYVSVVNTGGLISYLRVTDDRSLSVLPGLPFAGAGIDFAFLRLQAPQVVAFEGNQTILKMANQSDQDSMVSLTLRDNGGNVIAGPVEIELLRGNSTSRNIVELFELEDTGGSVSGWVDIESEQARLVGYAEISVANGRGISTVPFQTAAFRELIFSHVAQGLGLSTGLALVNPGQETAQIQLILRRPDGSQVDSADFSLAPGERLIGLVPDLFPGLVEELTAGSIRVVSDQLISGLELFFSNNLEQLAVVPSTGIGDPEIPEIPLGDDPDAPDEGDGGGNN
ncbi:MAG TPA: hypothetical protein VLV83_22375 [Acidobacteriota bacterium]|nr:hypothetical protein [Acidobacteriota bacterium]